MNTSILKIFIAITAIIFVAYVAKDTFIGGDSYFYLNVAFDKTANIETPFFMWLFDQVIPQNVILIKLLLCFMMLLNVFLVASSGIEFFGRDGWICGLFLFINGVFVFESLKFEDEQFIYPIFFLAFFLLTVAIRRKNYTMLLLPIVLSMVTFVTWIPKYTGIPWMSSLDYIPFSTVLPMCIALIGILGYFWNKKLMPMLIFAAPVILVAVFIPKFSMFAAPFLALGLFPVFKRLEAKTGVNEIHLAGITLIVALMSIFFFAVQPMTLQDAKAAEFTANYSNDFNINICNDWSYGYIIEWYGGKPCCKGGGTLLKTYENCVALTKEVPDNCVLIEEFGKAKVSYCP